MKQFALLILFLATHALPAQARQDLPDLAPREVEITGDLTIAFPTLRRQPIVGFNPPPRVPDMTSISPLFLEQTPQTHTILGLPYSGGGILIRNRRKQLVDYLFIFLIWGGFINHGVEGI